MSALWNEATCRLGKKAATCRRTQNANLLAIAAKKNLLYERASSSSRSLTGSVLIADRGRHARRHSLPFRAL
jgi:hypothetical protein